VQARPVHSAYFLAAGSELARRPTRRGGSMDWDLSLAIWARISVRKGWAMVPASIFWAPGARIRGVVVVGLEGGGVLVSSGMVVGGFLDSLSRMVGF